MNNPDVVMSDNTKSDDKIEESKAILQIDIKKQIQFPPCKLDLASSEINFLLSAHESIIS